ncbi:HSP20-like chaperones superfamily protein [Striga hermonthica]|uniref:HSP20-like chaperones superfamily protein n=1 Tax=Striga hermonthica TaxID=68872 RepID=A0A9N7NLW4_STRHE|nr:HSP20-like chaperones superfamily protein [Striga hermonthica]
MAMRPRGGAASNPRRGARTGGVRPVYEDFRPVSEWKQDDESHILNIYLPGFMKEQIRVSTEGQNIIRVRGERLVGGNKWSRFLEEFQVPEDGVMNSIRAKFQGGVLAITVPKRLDEKPHDSPLPKIPKINNDDQKHPAIAKDEEKVLPEVSTSKPREDRSKEHEKISTNPSTELKTSLQNSQDKAFQSAEEKSTESREATDDYNKRERDSRGGQRDSSVTQLRNTGVSVSRDAEKETGKSKGKNILSQEMKTKELPEGGTVKKGIPEKTKSEKELHGAIITKEKYRKAVKGLTELNEERQLLVNMGVAMLVVVALTAYVTYKFASGKEKN